MKSSVPALVSCLVAAVCLLAPARAETPPAPIPFQGTWAVDVERTLEEGKKSPKYDPSQEGRFEKMIRGAMSRMRLTITPDALTYRVGSKEKSVTYRVISSSADEAVVSPTVGKKDAKITFHKLEGGLMRFTSTATDDMDYYIWKPVTEDDDS